MKIYIEFIVDKLKDPRYVKIAVSIFLIIMAVFFIVLKSINSNENTIVIEEGETIEIGESSESRIKIYVDIDGEVINPGVYEVETGYRLFEVIELAGGLTEDADPKSVNRAKKVEDGDKIIIPMIGDTDSGTTQGRLVNLNLASKDDLETLPGIGPVTAETIITYREENNGFNNIEEIMNISGIGSVTYGKIKDLITT